MNKIFYVQVTETINHMYKVVAANEEDAQEAYFKLTREELETQDIDGQRDWDSFPWDVTEEEDQ